MPESFTQTTVQSIGNKIRNRSRVVGADTVHDQAVYQATLPTYYALANSVAFAANKFLISLLNDTGSGKLVIIKKMFMMDVQVSNVTGVALRTEVKRITAHSGGTSITMEKVDSNNAALPAQITARTGATSVAEAALMFPISITNDESGATQAFMSAILLQSLNLIPEGAEEQELRLHPGEGLTVKQITSSTVGSFCYLIAFTVEDDY